MFSNTDVLQKLFSIPNDKRTVEIVIAMNYLSKTILKVSWHVVVQLMVYVYALATNV